MTDDFLSFADEQDEHGKDSRMLTWNILITDDEKDVHEATCLAIGREKICGRHLHFLHAYSSADARRILGTQQDIAVILLDVVMENESAGLDLIRVIREELGNTTSRIILRTGQPGYAPELEAITRYEINDYKAKSELTHNILITSLTAAIRSYAQIQALEVSKKGLETIIRASRELIYLRGYKEFASGLIIQLTGLLGLPEEGLVCTKRIGLLGHDTTTTGDYRVIAAAGRHTALVNQSLNQIHQSAMFSAISRAVLDKTHLFEKTFTCLYFDTPDHSEMVVYLSSGAEISPQILPLLEMFSTNISACMDNVALLERQHAYAYTDLLCGLPNRLSFLQQIDDCLQRKTTGLVAVLVDIDHFSQLNDTLGTEKGDELIKTVARRMCDMLGHHLIVARISGDTFGILGLTAGMNAEVVREVFRQPFSIDNASHTLSVTQGRAVLLQQLTSTEVLAQASMALKRAKVSLRGGSQEFHSDLLKETENRVQLLQNLRKSFTEERLFMVYQPKINLQSGAIAGFEALMRWKKDDGEYVPPLQFIPIAESSGLIVPLGEWALRSSLVEAVRLQALLDEPAPMAVNVSVVQFAHPDFMDMLSAALAYAGAGTDLLELEITESVAMQDIAVAREKLEALHKLGIRISIDDFGTGFSSLSYLEQLPVHALKIDKSFVDRLSESPAEVRIPETILQLGHVLNLQIVAEGVETREQADWLRSKGCHLAQGYYFGRPMDSDALTQWIANYLPGQTPSTLE
jgi:diguanylate cyclase (GGDEF)-like protein